ncbi:S41 family peptidase [Flagellimonas beolgyonensis]|uniref:S41 family peptidase n=1 Tax=Flagellimonas beolgyonensis TaxID=864064 RepID=UPI003D65DADA
MNTVQKVLIYFLMYILASLVHTLFAQSTDDIDRKKDLSIYKSSLEEQHINLYHSITEEEFAKDWKHIYDSVAVLNDFDITLRLMRLTRRIDDGHTAVSLRNVPLSRFPFEVEYIDDHWRVVKASKVHEDLLKLTLAGIDGVPIEKIASKVAKVAQFVENEYSQVIRTGSYMNISELLYALHITKKRQKAIFTFLAPNNKEVETTLKALDEASYNKTTDFVHAGIGIPEITKPKNAKFPYLWYVPIEGTKAVYINFESYPTFEDMQGFGAELVGYISANQIKQVVMDLRHNGGGDLYVGMVLAYALNLADSIDWENGVFVLTSNRTFSAGTSNAALFKQLLNATIVGQPTGSNPNGYQDMDSFMLPGSKLTITYSKRLFRLSNQENTALQPDMIINQQEQHFLEGTDTVLKQLIERL